MKIEKIIRESIDKFDDDHLSASLTTPIRDDAFDMSDQEKISLIRDNVEKEMEEEDK